MIGASIVASKENRGFFEGAFGRYMVPGIVLQSTLDMQLDERWFNMGLDLVRMAGLRE